MLDTQLQTNICGEKTTAELQFHCSNYFDLNPCVSKVHVSHLWKQRQKTWYGNSHSGWKHIFEIIDHWVLALPNWTYCTLLIMKVGTVHLYRCLNNCVFWTPFCHCFVVMQYDQNISGGNMVSDWRSLPIGFKALYNSAINVSVVSHVQSWLFKSSFKSSAEVPALQQQVLLSVLFPYQLHHWKVCSFEWAVFIQRSEFNQFNSVTVLNLSCLCLTPMWRFTLTNIVRWV